MTQAQPTTPFTPDQFERREVLFGILISIFEPTSILVYGTTRSRQTARLGQTWEDDLRAGCRRRDFRDLLPKLLEGEDPDFQAHIRLIAQEEADAGSSSESGSSRD